MHGNDFKHHFRRLYIIFNHIESYTKLPKSHSNAIYAKTNYQNMFSNFLKHEVFMLFHWWNDSILHTSYDFIHTSTLDLSYESYEVCNILSFPYRKSLSTACFKKKVLVLCFLPRETLWDMIWVTSYTIPHDWIWCITFENEV